MLVLQMRIHSLLHSINIFLLIWPNSWLHFLPFLREVEEEEEGEGSCQMRIHIISIFLLIWLTRWLPFLPFLRGAEAEAEAEAMIHLLLIILYVNL